MSKIIDMIHERMTNDRRYMPAPVKWLDIHEEHICLEGGLKTGYRIDVTIGGSAFWETGKSDGRIMRNIRQSMENEIFGEFRGMLYEARQQIDSMEYDEAGKTIDSIIDLMFSA